MARSMTEVDKPEIEISVEPEYVESRSDPDRNLYFFAYRVRITNNGNRKVRLISRHWIISDESGNREEVKGIGVVGAQPRLGPGDSFSYMSFCPLGAPVGSMEGSFQMESEDGEEFDAPIAPFTLIIPSLVN